MTIATDRCTDITTTLMEVGPDHAAKWLEGNVRNRRIDQRHIDYLAQEMTAGHWYLTHQGIAFDIDGALVDGQHRLWAVLQSGCTIRTYVSFGLAPETIESIDGGKARSVVDRMMLSGQFEEEGVNKNHAATLRELVRGLGGPSRLPYHREVELMARHVAAVRYASSHVETMAKGVNVSYVRAVIARAWYSVDLDRLAQFCRVLSTGMPESPDDAGIIKLRDQLMAVGSTRNRAIQRELYGKVERVLTTWLRGESRSVLRPAKEELFPLPEEVAN